MEPGEKNLNTYRILFLIKGILDLLLTLAGLLYIVIGSIVGEAIRNDPFQNAEELPFDPSSIFTTVGIILIVISLLTGIPALIATAKIQRRESRSFIIVAAALNCLTGVLGIILCIFTVLELQKPHVREVFKS